MGLCSIWNGDGGGVILKGHISMGFNGKENDNEVKGEMNMQDQGVRICDPRELRQGTHGVN